jgi:2-C-methyl-D-erythritol 2,4-cyclodiphosphate synthase
VNFRIGHGFDVHRFGDGDFVTLCGVRIPHQNGLVAHSDGDVALHALCDALLGAAGLGDIGHHFPDTDIQYKGVDSRRLLRHVVALLAQHHWVVNNVDVTIVAQTPRMAPFIEDMRKNIADDCRIAFSAANVKATTTEALGYVGRKEGIAVHAVASLVASEP